MSTYVGTMHILRGVSGSGKSTRAKELVKEYETRGNSYIVCSADDYFINKETGKYEFDSSKLRSAYAWCRTRAETAIEMNAELIVIDNTNTQKWEYEQYVKMAEDNFYKVVIEKIGQLDESNLKVYANRNRHNVPLDVIRKQARRFDK